MASPRWLAKSLGLARLSPQPPFSEVDDASRLLKTVPSLKSCACAPARAVWGGHLLNSRINKAGTQAFELLCLTYKRRTGGRADFERGIRNNYPVGNPDGLLMKLIQP